MFLPLVSSRERLRVYFNFSDHLRGSSLRSPLAALRSRTSLSPQAVGGFAGLGFIEVDGQHLADNNPIIIGEDEAGTLELSGVFKLFDGSSLPASTALFVYLDNDEIPDDFAFGPGDLDTSTGGFTFTIADLPSTYTRLILSFAVLDPADALEDANPDRVFPLDVVNNGCSSPLSVTLEWNTDDTVLDLWVYEPGGRTVSFINRRGVSMSYRGKTIGRAENRHRPLGVFSTFSFSMVQTQRVSVFNIFFFSGSPSAGGRGRCARSTAAKKALLCASIQFPA